MLQSCSSLQTVVVAFCLALFSTTTVSAHVDELNPESSAEALAKVCSRQYDYSKPNVIKQIKDECGIPFKGNYDFKGCIPTFENDPCLPTGFTDAVEKGGVWEELWKAELWVSDDKKAMAADRLLRKLMARHPENTRAKWLFAKNLFFRAERMDEDAVDSKDVLLTEGWDAAKECVKLAPKDINCLLHLGTLMGRWGTNQGIVKVLTQGDKVETAWLEGAATKEHYRFPSTNTSLGASYYGLGIFYRLVPDSWWFNLFFGYRGDITKTIMYLKRSIATKDNQIEIHTELAAAYYCRYTRDDDEDSLEAGNEYVKKCQALKPDGALDEMSQEDCGKLRADPDLGCGYSRDRQQETDVDKFKEVHDKEG